LNRAAIRVALIFFACGGILSCGSPGNPNGQQTSGLTFRAFVSDPLHPVTGGGGGPVLSIINATTDVESPFLVNLSGIQGPGLMALSPNLAFTLVSDTGSNAISIIDNARESSAVGSSGMNLPSIPIPGPTESMVVGADNGTGYIAVPTAPQINPQGPPGGIIVLNLSAAAVFANVAVPSARYVTISHNGNRVLAFGDNATDVVVIAPSLIATNVDPRTFVCCFDHPVWGVVSSDDSTAYILNCGPECGGTTASISVLDLTTNTITTTVPVQAATYGKLNGNTLYVAGTPPGNACPSGTAVATCGVLTTFDITTGTPLLTSSFAIADGYHNRIEFASNGRVYVGSKNCTGAIGMRGCLSIFNTATMAVVVPPAQGDVTGIAPITGRNVVYVCEGGAFQIYDTTTDTLKVFPSSQTAPVITGMAVDVKLVDP
jgi:hypothetical protein